MELLHPVNYLAVFICGIIAMGMGVLYYSPLLLGKIWIATVDIPEEELKKGFNPLKVFGIAFISHLIMAYMLARLLGYTGAATPEEGIRIAFMAWLGFIATTMIINLQFQRKSITQFFIDSGYHFLVLIINGFILGLWI